MTKLRIAFRMRVEVAFVFMCYPRYEGVFGGR